jgi:SAM-dependent methyltransferase
VSHAEQITTVAGADPVDAFIRRWQGREGGQERANYGLFLIELCDTLGLPRPEPAGATSDGNDYVFERAVRRLDRDGAVSHPRIDLYRRGCFILEAKQSRLKGARNEIVGQLPLPVVPTANQGRRSADRAWDVLMVNARQQAEAYVPLLPVGHDPPPFLVVCDVGHCFEVYANFRRDGKVYDQFPDRRGFRIYLDDLRDAAVRERLVRIWTDPASLDPARHAARVTRAIAERLAAVSKALEAKGFPPEEVAMFLMRCLFTMFAEDVGLLPEASFKGVLERCEAEPSKFVPMVGQLWEAMDRGDFAYAIECKVRCFNGAFFKERKVLPLGPEEIGELRRAAGFDWRDVDPSIFGTLLEQALDPKDRRRLGAHYTPRAYVERLVVATVIEPLRADWLAAFATAERQRAEGRAEEARRTVAAFHDRLCATRILDPACGTGNFLYVALELMKRLEGEVLEALAALGGQEALSGLEGHTVDPHQFLGLEVNPRAAAIAELVLWIGHLQWHLRTRGGMPNDPVLQAFRNIVVKDAVLEAETVLARDASGRPVTRPGPDGARIETYDYRNPRRPEWPAAEFIVGNPPFIGKGEAMRAALGQEYLEALKAAHPDMNESADFVMYWWDRAADLLTREGTALRRFGFVTTNSITQVFNRRVVERHARTRRPVSIVFAIPDHPWTKASPDAAAVRIAMTVAEAGIWDGTLWSVMHEAHLDSDVPSIELWALHGSIHPDLSVGANLTNASKLLSNSGESSNGMLLAGRGFLLDSKEAEHLRSMTSHQGVIRPYINGRELYYGWTNRYVVDCSDFNADTLRSQLPRIYQHLLATVKVERDKIAERTGVKDAQDYARNWWKFAKTRNDFRKAAVDLRRFIGTTETAKHRIFKFIEGNFVHDHMVIGFAFDDGFVLGVLSSRIHNVWSLASGGTLEDRPRYSKSRCFDPFPFPAADDGQKQRVRALAEDLDAHRKRVLAEPRT